MSWFSPAGFPQFPLLGPPKVAIVSGETTRELPLLKEPLSLFFSTTLNFRVRSAKNMSRGLKQQELPVSLCKHPKKRFPRFVCEPKTGAA